MVTFQDFLNKVREKEAKKVKIAKVAALPGIEFLEEKMAETNKIRSVNNFHVFSLSSSGDGLVKLRHRLVQERRTT